MADLSSIERRKLERLLRMSGGYVLDFTDRTFSEFFEEHTRSDIGRCLPRMASTTCRAATVPIERVVTPTTASTQT